MEVEMHIAQKYMVLTALVCHLAIGNDNNKRKVKKALALPIFREEPFGYTGLYIGLIQSLLDNKALEYICSLLSDAESENMFYDEMTIEFFQQLKSCQDEIHHLLSVMEAHLSKMAYLQSEDKYNMHQGNAQKHMILNEILYQKIAYKKSGTVIKKPMVFLEGGFSTQGHNFMHNMHSKQEERL